MASANQVALDEGRITYNQFESMAAAKFTCYGNFEDLDPNVDYTRYDIIKVYPVIAFDTNNGRDVVSPKGFAKYMMESLGIDDFDTSVVDDDRASFVYQDLGWTWAYAPDGSNKIMEDMIYYTFGASFNGKSSPLANHCIDYHQMYE